MDRQWWEVHLAEVHSKFRGELVTGLHRIAGVRRENLKHPQNSGAGAIALAAARGAHRIVLLGFDCQHTGGRRHWHGDHPAGTAGNAAPSTVAKWPAQFAELRDRLGRIEIINCSRETALTVFPRKPLREALT